MEDKINNPIIFRDEPAFFPKKTLLLWLRTSKRKYIDKVSRPGLFSTHNAPMHLVAFLLILVFEIYATILTSQQGYDEIVKICILVGLDFIAAVLFHYWTAKRICLLRNHELIVNTKFTKLKIDKKLNSALRVKYFGHFVLFLFAGIKIFFATTIFLGQLETSFYIICLLYVLGALFHSTSTGNFAFNTLHYFAMKMAKKKNYESWGKFYGLEEPIKMMIKGSKGIDIKEKNESKHEILLHDSGEYQFKSKGYLTDEELSNLIGMQMNDNAKAVIAVEGVRFQLQMIDELPGY